MPTDNLEYITKRTNAIICPRPRSEFIEKLLADTPEGNLRWYIENQETLVWLYDGKYLVIVDRQVLGIFDDQLTAHRWACDKFFGESFMVLLCERGTSQYYIEL